MGKVLVTGADGFIGSHLVEHLVGQEQDVRALVYYNSLGSWGWLDTLGADVLKRVEVVAGDVRDPGMVRTAVAGCETVLHLAALIGIPYSYTATTSYVDTNVAGTLHVLEAARDFGVQKVVHTSTSEVYGSAQYVPIDERHPLVAQSPYAATKIGADSLALSFHRSFDLPVAICRPFNTYGPRQSARAVIPTIISQIASGEREIRLGSLTPTRDFSYVADTAAGFAAVAASASSVGEVINLGSGFEVSILDTVQLIAEAMAVQVDTTEVSERQRPQQSEVTRLFADVRKAQSLLHWSPQYGGREGFLRGLRRTTEWFCEPKNLAHYRPGAYST